MNYSKAASGERAKAPFQVKARTEKELEVMVTDSRKEQSRLKAENQAYEERIKKEKEIISAEDLEIKRLFGKLSTAIGPIVHYELLRYIEPQKTLRQLSEEDVTHAFQQLDPQICGKVNLMRSSYQPRHTAAHPTQTNGLLLQYSQLLDSVQVGGGNEYEKVYRELVVGHNPRLTESDRTAGRK